MATSLKRRGVLKASRTHSHTEVETETDSDYEFVGSETIQPNYHVPKSEGRFKRVLDKIAKVSTQDRYAMGHLANVLVNGERNDMLNAVDRLRGKSRVLFELACYSNFQYVRLSAVANMNGDAEALGDIAKYCPHADTRSAALDELASDGSALADVACSSYFKDTRLDAVMLMGNTKSLVFVATRSPHTDSRLAALEKISFDHNSLHRVAEESIYRSARISAVKKLASNMMALSMLLSRTKYPEIRKLVAELLSQYIDQIDNADVLVELAKCSANQDARYLAVGKLWRNSSSLRRVVGESNYKDAKSTALMLLSDMVENLDDSDALVDVATQSPYEDCRAAAVERLVGMSSSLLSVATKSKYKATRNLAITKLKKDPETLKSVFKLSKYQDTRTMAHKIVSSSDVFKTELEKILG